MNGIRLRNYMTREIVIRLLLFVYFLYLEFKKPFIRLIQPEEWWLYKYPRKEDNDDLLPTHRLFTLVFVMPVLVTTIFYIRATRKVNKPNPTAKLDLTAGLLSSSLALLLNGVITDLIKNQVGRPRPDFWYRCFPDGVAPEGQPGLFDLACTNPDQATIEEGRRSFPSGHSSFSFCLTVWLALYMAAKLKICQATEGKLTRTEHLLLVLILPMCATLAAIGRTCDYKHHWQDVSAGSALGALCGWTGFRQFYPRLGDKRCGVSYIEQKAMSDETEKIYDLGSISIDKRRRPSNV